MDANCFLMDLCTPNLRFPFPPMLIPPTAADNTCGLHFLLLCILSVNLFPRNRLHRNYTLQFGNITVKRVPNSLRLITS